MLKMNFLKIFPSNIAYSACIMLAYHSHLFLQIYYLKYSPVYTIPSIHTFYYHFISQSIWFCHSLCVLIFCFLHFFMYSLMLFFPWNILRNIREISKGHSRDIPRDFIIQVRHYHCKLISGRYKQRSFIVFIFYEILR